MTGPLAALINTPTLPSLGPDRRADAWPLDTCRNRTEKAIVNADVPFAAARLIRSAVLLWHDHLDESHTLSQDIRDRDGSFLHALMHRREPDYPNAKYWFNQTGPHDVFPEILKRAHSVLNNTNLTQLSTDKWDPFALVDAVSATRPNTEEYRLLLRVQQIEFQVLLERFSA